MTVYGVTPQGFVGKTVEDVLLSLEESQRSLVSDSIDTSSYSPLGQINGILASHLREVWEAAEDEYAAWDPDAASDDALSNVSALTGTRRNDASFSRVLCNVSLAAGTYPTGTLIANVDGNPDAIFENADEIVQLIGGVHYSVPFVATDTGPVEAPAGLLTLISVPVPGWTAITNPLAATPGENIESDPELRLRREQELAAAGSSSTRAIRAALSDLDGMEFVTVLENRGSTVDANGLPGHSVEAVIYDGTPAAILDNTLIAQAIYDNLAAGAGTFGSSSALATDGADGDQLIKYTRVTGRQVWIEVDVTGTVSSADAEAAILLINPNIGQDVVVKKIESAVMALPGAEDITQTRLGFTVAPVGTANLVIGTREIALFDGARITINVTP